MADPQLIDPHSYPGRPWPLNPLTVMVTDNYLRRSYNQLQQQLHPDTLFFLGDLFDGGREWKTAHGEFKDYAWAPHPKSEEKYLKTWNRKYGEDFWLHEYKRFGDIFFKPWNAAGEAPGLGQRGRKLVASLPGNHDLGFGSDIKIPVRNRFEAYFGEGNRVDVIGNHTFVSVDTVSLSAASSEETRQHDLRGIYMPAQLFLKDVKWTKRKAVERELRFQRGEIEEVRLGHKIEDLDKADFGDRPNIDPGEGKAELPSILLTHVPLYRPPGTPCGPLRERWPPTKPPKGQTDPVVPDDRNAISVSRGYQYQNVLSEDDSANLIKSVGNVVHVFSGDDHDYCQVTHDKKQENVPEITVKSMSMAMGVPTPGFLMVSLHNPIDANGNPLAGDGKTTFQTHLCLLPRSASIFAKYAAFVLISLALLTVRAFLVPALNLPRFALEPLPGAGGGGGLLPVSKAKVEDYDEYALPAAGFSASRFLHSAGTRDRGGGAPASGVRPNGLAAQARNASPKAGKSRRSKEQQLQQQGKWGWAGGLSRSSRGPKIEIGRYDDDIYDGGKWKAASSTRSRSRSAVGVVIQELWTTVWRVAWMVGCFWFYLSWKG